MQNVINWQQFVLRIMFPRDEKELRKEPRSSRSRV